MGHTPADRHTRDQPRPAVVHDRPVPKAPTREPDPLSRLEHIDDVPLAEQVAVFDAIHAQLSSRLTSAES